MVMNIELGLTIIGVGCLGVLIQRLLAHKRYPVAPGPRIAALNDYWYLWKVWKGRFEAWNVQSHEAYGPILRVGPRTYSIDSPDAVKEIYGLTSIMPKTAWYETWGDMRVPNHNLFTARDRQFHAGMRRRVANMYSMTSIKSYEPSVDKCIDVLLRKFDDLATRGEVMDLQQWMQCYAFDVISEITFGSSVGFLESDCKDIDGIMHSLDMSLGFSTLLGISRPLLPLWLAMYGFPVSGLLKWVDKLTSARKSRSTQKSGSIDTFYDKLEVAREKSAEDYDRYHMGVVTATNMAAGSDTTGISLTSVLFNIASNPKIYAKLRQELTQATMDGKADSPITFEQAQNLPYLNMVIKEALRIHPATGLPMWREVQIGGADIAGTHFPAGSIVGINTWVAHRNKTVFGADANIFRPERWDSAVCSAERLAAMERYYIPFGTGTRTCIGRHISTLEMIKVIPELVRRYEFDLLSTNLQYVNHWFVKQQNVKAVIRYHS